MSFMAVNFDCCTGGTGSGDATLANQAQILADLAALKVCADAIQADVTDIQAGVDNIEEATVKPKLC